MEYFFSILFGTFILEDVTLAVALALVAEDKVSFEIAFAACFIGICLGDLGLYSIGYFSEKIKFINQFKFIQKIKSTLHENKQSYLSYSIIVSRFIPGTRIPTYFISGFTKYPISKFILLTLITVFAWVAVAFLFGKSIEPILSDHLLLTVIFFLIFLKIIKLIAPIVFDPWARKASRHAWRQYLHFEFWPPTLFYIPIIFYYIVLSLKYRSFLTPFYANPSIENGGLIGESKEDLLKYFTQDKSDYILKYIKINAHNKSIENIEHLLQENDFSFPFILKPDVGQRGYAVRIIKDKNALIEYLAQADFDLIVQELSPYQKEAGIFYIRRPSESKGLLFSITDKHFPTIVGNGKSTVGQLILKDKRARIIAGTYFTRHKSLLNKVLEPNEPLTLTECGNHCQGAIFSNANNFITPELTEAIDYLAKKIPHFHFGRFDIRYHDVTSLKAGKKFHIIEINGAGSEATHIWDEKTKLTEAYKTLFQQWRYLFQIGDDVKKLKIESKVKVKAFLKESFRVFFRKNSLSRSS